VLQKAARDRTQRERMSGSLPKRAGGTDNRPVTICYNITLRATKQPIGWPGGASLGIRATRDPVDWSDPPPPVRATRELGGRGAAVRCIRATRTQSDRPALPMRMDLPVERVIPAQRGGRSASRPLTASVLFHGAVLGTLLILVPIIVPAPPLELPSVTMMLEPAEAPPAAAPQPQSEAHPAPPQPQPVQPPAQPPPQPAQPPAQPVQPQPVQPPPQPVQPQAAPPPPQPEPLPPPAAPVPPPPVPAAPPPEATSEPLPLPLPPPEAPPPPPPRSVARPAHPAVREAPSPPVARSPLAPAQAPSQTMPAPMPAPGAPSQAAPSQAAPAPRISLSWERALSAWLASHKVYPEESRRRGEEGNVTVRFTVGPSGQVSDVTVVGSSGSSRLDAAAEALLRHAVLPPFDASMPQRPVTATVQIRYQLED
jgi:periplasmic protein TonB